MLSSREKEIVDLLDKVAMLIGAKIHEKDILYRLGTYTKMMDTVYENINRGVVIVDNEYRIVKINGYIRENLGLDIDEIQNRKIDEVFNRIALEDSVGDPKKLIYEDLKYKKDGLDLDLLYASTPVLVDDTLRFVIYYFEDYVVAKNFAISLTEQNDRITFEDIIGNDSSIVDFIDKAKRVSKIRSTILLVGETGTGKELFARSIHNESLRKNGPFIAINCGAIPETLIESELFGFEKGSFTGADKAGRKGKFYLADKGTIFLDEVENMPIYLQQKLLRVLERKEIDRIGSTDPVSIDVRIIAATNINLKNMVERGEFRADLYHRLNVIPLTIPPLRERGEDILFLADHFIGKFSKRFSKSIVGLEKDVRKLFMNYSWKGNVRELQNAIEYAINMENSQYISRESLPVQFRTNEYLHEDSEITKLDVLEKREIVKALDKFGWDDEGIVTASRALGLSRSTIYRRISKHGLKEK